MIAQTETLVTGIELSGPFVKIVLQVPAIAPRLIPGQFVMADLGSYLRTPLFPAQMDSETCHVLVSPAHPAAALCPGATIDLIGPLGPGFQIPTESQRLLLVAHTPHLPILLPLIEQGRSTTLLLSAPTAAELYPVRLLPPTLEIHLVTADGSTGYPGSLCDIFPDLVRWADSICIAADLTTYPMLAQIVREERIKPPRRFAQALVIPPMACGVGACRGCAVETAHGLKLACTDGPIFDLLELHRW